ncbi:MAG: GNAT family N-acetyltransferase [Acidobacteriaceae bacterium]|nr:GNAT family N-acetyltransferase [Acidobacteriaceae bacterium]
MQIHIDRLEVLSSDALTLLNEYYEAIDVTLRDTPETLSALLADPQNGLWLAYGDSAPLGCVVLRPLPSIPQALECKRLYVRPQARGIGLAAMLMHTLEDFAAEQGAQWIYLDSKDDLDAARALYRSLGYQPCERYNDNPQATIFLRKQLPPAS